ENCASGTFKINDILTTKPGATTGPERQGINTLLTEDPNSGGVHVVYNPSGCTPGSNCTSAVVVGGCAATGTCTCAGGCPYGGAMSPRIVQAAICDPTDPTYGAACGASSGVGQIKVTNILSFFIIGCDGNIGSCPNGGGSPDIDAVIIASAGEVVSG